MKAAIDETKSVPDETKSVPIFLHVASSRMCCGRSPSRPPDEPAYKDRID